MYTPPNYTNPKYARPEIDCGCNGYYHGNCKLERKRLEMGIPKEELSVAIAKMIAISDEKKRFQKRVDKHCQNCYC